MENLRRLVSPKGDIQAKLLRQTAPKVLPNLKSLDKMLRFEEAFKRDKVLLHQEDFFVFHTTLGGIHKPCGQKGQKMNCQNDPQMV